MTKRIRVTKRGYIRNSPLYGPSIRGERGPPTRSLPRTTPRSGGKRLTIRGAPGDLAASTPTNGRTAFVTAGAPPIGGPVSHGGDPVSGWRGAGRRDLPVGRARDRRQHRLTPGGGHPGPRAGGHHRRGGRPCSVPAAGPAGGHRTGEGLRRLPALRGRPGLPGPGRWGRTGTGAWAGSSAGGIRGAHGRVHRPARVRHDALGDSSAVDGASGGCGGHRRLSSLVVQPGVGCRLRPHPRRVPDQRFTIRVRT